MWGLREPGLRRNAPIVCHWGDRCVSQWDSPELLVLVALPHCHFWARLHSQAAAKPESAFVEGDTATQRFWQAKVILELNLWIDLTSLSKTATLLKKKCYNAFISQVQEETCIGVSMEWPRAAEFISCLAWFPSAGFSWGLNARNKLWCESGTWSTPMDFSRWQNRLFFLVLPIPWSCCSLEFVFSFPSVFHLVMQIHASHPHCS